MSAWKLGTQSQFSLFSTLQLNNEQTSFPSPQEDSDRRKPVTPNLLLTKK